MRFPLLPTPPPQLKDRNPNVIQIDAVVAVQVVLRFVRRLPEHCAYPERDREDVVELDHAIACDVGALVRCDRRRR